jgi:hypothetical protein
MIENNDPSGVFREFAQFVEPRRNVDEENQRILDAISSQSIVVSPRNEFALSVPCSASCPSRAESVGAGGMVDTYFSHQFRLTD